MPEKKKITAGQQFMKLLENATKDKSRLLDLASAVIKHSHSKRGLKSRNLPDSESAVKMSASIAKFNAIAGKDVSTDGMLAMVANTYRQEGFGSPKKFKEDFKKKHPEEYESSSAKNAVLMAQLRAVVNG
ncbi:MAG: hypothetical protein MR350_06215 [Alphaproteobacteria bacterium]|nr:hypothetical protein [Alphaproteobacteria bacterium]